MKDDGARLSIQISGPRFNIIDGVSGKYMLCRDNGTIIATLSKACVEQHIQNLNEALNSKSVKRIHKFFRPASVKGDTDIVIQEVKHETYRITHNGYSAEIKNGIVVCDKGFDNVMVLRGLNYIWSKLVTMQASLAPTRDIVRRIADVGVLVWVWGGHSIVCYEKNIAGSIMLSALFDGKYYSQLFVSVNLDQNVCRLFDSDLRLVVELPVDQSILTYYPNDTDALD